MSIKELNITKPTIEFDRIKKGDNHLLTNTNLQHIKDNYNINFGESDTLV